MNHKKIGEEAKKNQTFDEPQNIAYTEEIAEGARET